MKLMCIFLCLTLTVAGCGKKDSSSEPVKQPPEGSDATDEKPPSKPDCQLGSVEGLTDPSGHYWRIRPGSPPRLEIIGDQSVNNSIVTMNALMAWGLSLPLEFDANVRKWAVHNGDKVVGHLSCIDSENNDAACMEKGVSFKITIGNREETGSCLPEG